MKYLTTLLIMTIMSFSVLAQDTTEPLKEEDFEKLVFSNKKVRLTKQEKQAIAIANKWRDPEFAPEPVTELDGTVSYLYGVGQVSVMCAVLQVCDIQLQQGETVNQGGVHIGDNRWQISPAITGSGANQMIHVIVKPLDVGLDTTLILATNRRTYNIRLRSHRTEFMPKVKFTYQEDAMAKFDLIARKESQFVHNNKIPQTGEKFTDLDFDYSVKGKAKWKPLRVYNDGIRTIIQMPKIMQQTEAPTLLVIRENDGLWSDDEEVLVNYRVQGDRFIVDTLFDKAILIAGVGSNQTKVTVQRAPNGSETNHTFKAGGRK